LEETADGTIRTEWNRDLMCKDYLLWQG